MWLFWALVCLIQHTVVSEENTTKRHWNPEVFMTIPEIIEFWGYPSEEYEILTDDGYYLTLNRIPFGRQCPENTEHRPVVLMASGLISDARVWITNVPRSSLGFFLADAGYDIWMLNNRGTTWSRKHKNFPVDQEEFWNFSFHEMAMKDIPAAMDFILQKTQQKKMHFVGHSQGGLLGIMVFSAMPQLAEKVKLMICLAPPYTMVGTKGLMRLVLMLPETIIRHLWGNKEFRVSSSDSKKNLIDFCSNSQKAKFCTRMISVSAGYNNNNINASRAEVYVGIYPDFTSTKTIIHWSQIAKSKEFKYFDYHSKNQDIYNMTKPPFYKVEALTVPTAIWDAEKDIIATTKDIAKLVDRIPSLVFHKTMPSWNHADFIWGLNTPKLLYPDLLYLLQKYR